jgi:hypothetical protein
MYRKPWIGPDLRIYHGQRVSVDDVYDWCRRGPYMMTFSQTVKIVRRDDRSTAAFGGDIDIWPAFVEQLRAIALVVSA